MEAKTFLQHLLLEKRYSALTVSAYQRDIAQFSGFILEQYDLPQLSQVTVPIAKSWIVHLVRSGIKASSIRRKITSLSSLYKFGIAERQVELNPFSTLNPPKKSSPVIHRYTKTQVAEFLKLLPHATDYNSARTRAIILMLYGTGMRRAELIKLCINDLDLKSRTIKVTGKRNKQRIIPLAAFLCVEWEHYLLHRRSTIYKDDSHLMFITDKGKPLYPAFINRITDRYRSHLQGLHPHAFRHSLATHLLENGVSLLAIKEMLGHSSLASTQVYTHYSIDQLKNIYTGSHPLADND